MTKFPPARYEPEEERARLAEAMRRLPLKEGAKLDRELRMVCAFLSNVRQHEGPIFAPPAKLYKPDAAYVTDITVAAYGMLTGKKPRRVSRPRFIGNRRSCQEDGEFARFLQEVFDIIGIKASADGQLRQFRRSRSAR